MKKFKTLFIALMVLVTAAVATTILVGCNKAKVVYSDGSKLFPVSLLFFHVLPL